MGKIEPGNTFGRGLWAPLLVLGFTPGAIAAEEWFDRIEQALTWSAMDDRLRSRVSGTLDLEGYHVQLPAPGLLPAGTRSLLNPRLTLFLDAQWGSRAYAFVQARADRGFDPGDGGSRLRIDEYAVRLTPWSHRRLNLQLGKFATVVGNWMARHESWPNPLITAPLPYEYLTGIWDSDAIRSSGVLLQWSHVRPGLPAGITAIEKSLRVPIIWGPSYALGAALAGEWGEFRYALEVKNGSLSSRPEVWDDLGDGWRHPTVGGRLGYRPNEMWHFGVSASSGPYLRAGAERSLPAGRGMGDYRQIVVGQDIAFAWHHLQLWSEVYASRFEIPGVGDADTVAYYAEAKYKFTPQFFGAVRWNQQLFGTIPDRGVAARWGHDVWRLDLAPGYRLTPHVQLKFQYSLQQGDSGGRRHTRTLAAQVTVRF